MWHFSFKKTAMITINKAPIEFMLRLVSGQTASYTGRTPADPNNKRQRGTLSDCKTLVRQEHAKTEGQRFSRLIEFSVDGLMTDKPLPDDWPRAPSVEAQAPSDEHVETVPDGVQDEHAGLHVEAPTADTSEAVPLNSGEIEQIPEHVSESSSVTTTDHVEKLAPEVVQKEVAKLTKIRYDQPISKRLTKGGDGKLVVTTVAAGDSGVATVLSPPNIEALAQIFRDTTASDILVSGVPDQETAFVVKKARRTNGNIARTKNDLPHPKGGGVMFIDNDHPIGVGDDQFDVYAGVMPPFRKASYVVAPSSSAYIYDKATGEKLKGAGGQHYAIPVKNASDIPRAIEVMHKRMVLAGHGKAVISKNGRILIRSQVDKAMKTSCQPLFQRVRVGESLEQRKAEHIKSCQGETFLFDTSLIPDFTTEEQAQLAEIENNLKASVAVEAAARREEWIDEYAPKIAERLKAEIHVVAQRLRESMQKSDVSGCYDIYPGQQIQFEDGPVDVLDVLADPLKYDGEPCADVYDPDRGVGGAMFFANEGEKPLIQSYAHGGQKYFLHANIDQKISRTYDEIMADVASLDPDTPTECIEDLIKEALSLSVFDRKRVHIKIKKKTGLTLVDLKSFENEYREAIGDMPEKVDHLDLAKKVVETIGHENVITGAEGTYTWGSGLWQRQDDRATKYLVQQSLAENHTDIFKAVVDGVADVFRTYTFSPNHQFDVGPPETVNCINGEVALIDSKWTLSPPNREHYRTTQIPVAFDSTATAPLFARYLEQVFAGDGDCAEKCRAILEMIGYTLMSHCRHERFIILIGQGANGKSVLLSVLEGLVGHSNVAAVQPSQFDRSFMRAHLLSKLANIVTEIKQGEVIDDASLKGIVSGEPTTVEIKFKDPFNMRPFATCWFGTNHMPHTRDFSDALFRRALVVNFNNVFKPELGNSDPNLTAKLIAELPGILNMALGAYAAALVNGFTLPASCAQAREAWRLEADQVAQFVDDQCVRHEGSKVAFSLLYAKYKGWCDDNGINKSLTAKSFRERLDRLGYGHARTSEAKYVTGMRFALTAGEYTRFKGE